MKNNPFLSRRKKIQANLAENQAILISNPSDIFYLTNFQFLVPQEREALLVLCKNKSYLLYPNFSPIPNDKNLIFIVSPHYLNLAENLTKIVKNGKISNLIFDPYSLFYIEYEQLKKLKIKLTKQEIKTVENLRIFKDEEEILQIKKSCKIAKKSLKRIRNKIIEGISEIELKNVLELELNQLDCAQTAFPTIVAFGKNTALPHHQPTNKKLKKNMPVLIDFGAKINGYCSDMTRTFWYGDKIDPEFKKIKKSVQKAYKKTLEIIKQNKVLKAKQLDEIARESIKVDGYAKYFIHTTGHGLGIDIHEPPSLNWYNQQLISENMVITIEPGIYLPNKFGFRYENTVSLNQGKVTELSK